MDEGGRGRIVYSQQHSVSTPADLDLQYIYTCAFVDLGSEGCSHALPITRTSGLRQANLGAFQPRIRLGRRLFMLVASTEVEGKSSVSVS